MEESNFNFVHDGNEPSDDKIDSGGIKPNCKLVDKRPQFGGRFLLDPKKVFEHNAWDNVTWDAEQELLAANKVKENSEVLLNPELITKYENSAANYWDEFYGIHQNGFFKDRHWLFTEFPELKFQSEHAENSEAITTVTNLERETNFAISENSFPGAGTKHRVLEIGCGVGNTVFPILEMNAPSQEVFVYCCDFSEQAVKLVKEHTDFNPDRCFPFVCDVSADPWSMPFPEESLDIVILIFTLSAIDPIKMPFILAQIYRFLKPGGVVLFRDYGRYDMAQLRFKKGRCLAENFYVRGDGTRVYFFTSEELRHLFTQTGFVEELNLVDRRLQVNRSKCLKMYRIWLQAKYRKPS